MSRRGPLHGFLAPCSAIIVLTSAVAAQDHQTLTRADWGDYLEQIQTAAEHYVRDATRGSGNLQVTESGYLQADRYYGYAQLLAPDNRSLGASRRVVETQLARFRRQHRWRLLRAAVVGSFWGSPRARSLHDGRGLSLGRTEFSLQADQEIALSVVPQQQWALRHSRRRLPFLLQFQVGLGYEDITRVIPGQAAAAQALGADLLAGHAAVELDYTVLPLLSYVLPYVGLGYQGMLGYYDDGSSGGDYHVHGSYLRLGAALSLVRTIKVTADYSRSLVVYGSRFGASDNLKQLGYSSCADCYDGWSSTQLSLEFLF
jgi:hypothetical protein